MTDELEFSISQYLDGTLAAEDRAALEIQLASDAEARAVLDEYRKLQTHLVASRADVPTVDWDRLADQISAAVADADDHAEARQRKRFQIGTGWPLRFSAAACVLIVSGLGVFFATHHNAGPTNQSGQTPLAGSVKVSGPEIEAPAGSGSIDITVGPSPALAGKEADWRYAEGVVTRPAKVDIAGDVKPPSNENGDSSNDGKVH